MIAVLATALRLRPWVIWLGAGALLITAVVIERMAFGQRRYEAGVAFADAKWIEASARMQAEANEAREAADSAAAVREAQNDDTIKELRNEAAKGTDDSVGRGTRGVLERLRADQARR